MKQEQLTPDPESTPPDAELTLPEEIISELKQRYGPHHGIPESLETSILASARRQLATVRPVRRSEEAGNIRHRARRIVWPVSAAITTLVAVCLLLIVNRPGPDFPATTSTSSLETGQPGLRDLDRNGRVDILDAFQLAREILGPSKPVALARDMNQDGRVDESDVTIVAQQAVRL